MLLALTMGLAGEVAAQGMRPAPGQEPGDYMREIGNTRVDANNVGVWRQVRQGVQGYASIPDARAGTLVQPEGERWRALYNGPLKQWGGYALGAMIAILAVFFLVRGRIRIHAGPSGRTILRFDALDRFAHWLTAVSFILLALSGLNITFGRYVLLPLLGPSAFATLTMWGKVMHNYVGFAFIAGIVLMLVLWVKDNIPEGHDLTWIAMGGGLLGGSAHPPSRKFNAGQKLIFWSVILGGGAISYTGLGLMFPVGWFGTQDLQLSVLVHAGTAIGLITIVIAHIYIGTMGMEGAFDAMGTGYVDENWAREHHGIWVQETLGEPAPPSGHGQAKHA
ncbi:MAG: formate dehydrogenase subunit gamma [Alphaproteobacteria bacterium]|nr:formate dehydrogenase subunit gamma [Alphaproteobacteria bacterium]